MRAIAASILLLTASACAPNLSRSEGSLDIQALGAARLGDHLDLTIVSGDTRHALAIELASSRGRAHVDSVPAGAVVVTATLRAGAAPVATREGGGLVRAGEATLVVVDFGGGSLDGGTGTVESDPLIARIGGVGGSAVRNERLTLSAALDHDALEQFQRAARVALTTGELELSVASVDVELRDSSTGVQRLEQLWSGTITAALIDGHTGVAHQVVAEGATSGGRTASLTPNGAGLEALSAGLEEAELRVELSGVTPRRPTDTFTADLIVRVVLRARRD